MKLTELFSQKRPTLSFEVFPPKTTTSFENVRQATERIASLHPDFMSVTYGHGSAGFTLPIAENVQRSQGVPALAHLTCVSSTKEMVDTMLGRLRDNGIENILALRGDIPGPDAFPLPGHYRYAYELIEEIKRRGDFCIGAACYPEGHPESATQKDDIAALRLKAEAGCDFMTTQMFFDNNIYYRFLYKALAKGIDVPVTAGIMPVTNAAQVKRTISLTGNLVPAKFLSIVDRFGDNPAAMKQAGIAYATEQIIDLIANGVNHIHIYSMNKPDVAAAIMNNLSQIYVREQA
mgnify:CR=1 FL=1